MRKSSSATRISNTGTCTAPPPAPYSAQGKFGPDRLVPAIRGLRPAPELNAYDIACRQTASALPSRVQFAGRYDRPVKRKAFIEAVAVQESNDRRIAGVMDPAGAGGSTGPSFVFL